MPINTNVSNLPSAPNRSGSPNTFTSDTDAFLAALPTLQSEINAYAAAANSTGDQINEYLSAAEQGAVTGLDVARWDSEVTYARFDPVIGSDGNTYRSLVDNNLGNDPTTDGGDNWLNLSEVSLAPILKPELLSPTDGATDIGETPTLVAGNYYSLYGRPQTLSRFQVATDQAFTSIVYDSGEIAATQTHTVPAGNLQEGQVTYYWRAYYEDDAGNQSEFSDAFEFTTSSAFFDPNIGDAVEGGFFAGYVVSDVDNQTYAVIVSDGGGDTDRTGKGEITWRTSQTSLPEGQTLSDGKSVMDHIVNNETISDFPAFEWVQTTLNDTNYNGYSDWYIPARDELELVYRFFKPTTDTNDVTTRLTTGFGGDGAVDGLNNNSVPNRSSYTTNDPAQTAFDNFKTGNPDHLRGGGNANYWSSTDNSAEVAWDQRTDHGQQGTFNFRKTFAADVRAVRRIQV